MKKINFRWLFYPFLMFLLGINVVRNIFNGELQYIIITSCLIVLLGIYCCLKRYFKHFITLIICLIIGGSWYFVGVNQSFQTKEYVGNVVVVGRITDQYSENKYSYKIILDNVEINGINEANVMVEFSGCYQLPEIGDFVSFESELQTVRPFTLENFNTTCYRNGVRYYASCNYKNVVVSDGFTALDESIRISVKSMLYSNMSAENAETAYASLFGDKNNLSDDVYSAYQGAGIVHILTVSGLHVSFLISLIFGFMKKCKVNKYLNFAITTIFIIFYAYLCNFTPSVLRAGIMGIIYMLSKLLYRKYDSLNALGIAGFIICLTSPLSGLDVGFLMSVFCIVGINVIMPVLQRLLSKVIPKKFGDVFAVGLSAQIGIFPLLCLMGGNINILSIFANFFVVPLFGIVYPVLFSICLLSLILPFLSKTLVVIDFSFTAILLIAQFFNVNEIKFHLKNMGYLNILLFYVSSFIISDYLVLLVKQKFIVFTAVLLCFSFAFIGNYFSGENLSKISYISQYNQESVVLSTSSGQTMVVGDCLLLDKFQQKYKIKYDIFVANSGINSHRYDALQEMNIGSFCAYEDGMFSENFVCQFNKEYILGDFKLIYLAFNDDFIGIRVSFENNEVFIASNKNIDYNTFININNIYDFDFVFASYSLGEGRFRHISNKYVDGCDYSYNLIGNMSFYGKEFKLRRLD